MRIIGSTALAVALLVPPGAAIPPSIQAPSNPCADIRTLDGSCNNVAHPDWGQANTQYLRVAGVSYADGLEQPISRPEPRHISNRIFNDGGQNLFSENGVTQWGFAWGQFLDHTFGLRQEAGGEEASIAFFPDDPLEEFRNDLGVIPFARTPAASGTGTAGAVRQQINTVSSYIDAFAVYGGTEERLEWLREGTVDGAASDAGAMLMLPDGYLPRSYARGEPETAPEMAIGGRLVADPYQAMVAGDARANENLALLATHTLFALEHNRVVEALPDSLSDEERFQIARRVVGAEQQLITYTEFLPALGVRLAPYRGYRRNVDAGLGNEFATVGYRAHSMIHGELEPVAPEGIYSEGQLREFEDRGIEVEHEDGNTVLVIPLNLAFFNPDLLVDVGLGPVLAGLGAEPQYRNDEQIDNQLRSVLFQIPVAGNQGCLDGPDLPHCFQGVVDLGSIDVMRGRDHGMPTYTELRKAYGLKPRGSFTAITGESTARFPTDPEIDRSDPINDPDILDFVRLFDAEGTEIPVGGEEAESEAVVGIRRTTLAARLRAIYGTVDQLDAFVGMISERHLPASELGELQLAMWKRQFENLRDGDRFFYLNDPVLRDIHRRYGITYRHTLGEIIEMNTGVRTQENVFVVEEQ